MVEYRSRAIWVYDLQSLIDRGMYFSHMGTLSKDSRYSEPDCDVHIVCLMDNDRIDRLGSDEYMEVPK